MGVGVGETIFYGRERVMIYDFSKLADALGIEMENIFLRSGKCNLNKDSHCQHVR